ncbi:hypothetical protein DFH11DRAFT_1745748 [Phellopilus nigrolimitatus]|nr:hypothetical protein DFH11DRAFT_1745748 [Phellopilus nigrolimitatus]
MTTLTVTIRENVQHNGPSNLVLHASGPEFVLGGMEIIVNEMIFTHAHSTVYRASISGPGNIVLKLCFEEEHLDDLKKEAENYQTVLQGLRGSVVPEFYGFYMGQDADNRPIGCIVLEDCGESVEDMFCTLEIKDKMGILDKLGKMHMQNLHPVDFAERNVVHRDGQYRLIDFHGLKDHRCEFDGNWHEQDSRPIKFPCRVLHEIGIEEFVLWKHKSLTPLVTVAGYSVYEIEDYPSQDMIDKLTPEGFYSIPTNQKWLCEWLRKAKVIMDEDKDREELSWTVEELTHIEPMPKFTSP